MVYSLLPRVASVESQGQRAQTLRRSDRRNRVGSAASFRAAGRATHPRHEHATRRHVPPGSRRSRHHCHAFVWQNGKLTDLGTLGGRDSDTTGINDHGQIVGSSTTKKGRAHAVVWTLGHR
jgi:probable HAF family extracellular repeat protein